MNNYFFKKEKVLELLDQIQKDLIIKKGTTEDLEFIANWKEKYEEIEEKVNDWIDYYNNDRYQMGLQKLSPNEFYNYIINQEYPISVTSM